jgi:NAD(P)-dependent dehydrogenase (short-subunit alcohol dehydrogenase family)
MLLRDRVVVVTGGGAGLGAALARGVSTRDVAATIIVDVCEENASAVADQIDGHPYTADMSIEGDVIDIVNTVQSQWGAIDVWIANAGIGEPSDPFSGNDVYDRMWRLHVMSQVWAARALLPQWLARGSGHFAVVASSNALTTNPTSLSYAVSKHAQLAAVEWLAMTYGQRGISTTAFCPKGMRTPLLLEVAKHNTYAAQALIGAVTPGEAAETFLCAIEADESIAYTHPEILDEARLRLSDHGSYLSGLQRLHELVPDVGRPR